MEMECKVLDHGYVKLIETWGSDERIIESARMSTGKSFLGWGPRAVGEICQPNGEGLGRREPLPSFLVEVWEKEGRPDFINSTNPYRNIKLEAGDERLLRRLYEKRHTTPFEMAGATIEVQAPIMVFREWHRHRTQSYSEMSARYSPIPNQNYVPTLERMMNFGDPKNKQASKADGAPDLTEEAALDWLQMLENVYSICDMVYNKGLEVGVPKELARLPMPVGRFSRMRASANLLNWIRFLRLRLPEDAQWEIRAYAGETSTFLSHCFPRTMGLFGEELIK
jgi:thymidylate synthase (FAD)